MTDTQRTDKVFSSVKSSVKELEILITKTEHERTKQQTAIHDIMGIIKIGGGMMPNQRENSTQTDLDILNSKPLIFAAADIQMQRRGFTTNM